MTKKTYINQNSQNKHSLKLSLSDCWKLVKKGVEYHILDDDELKELAASLEKKQDYINDELGFEFIDNKLRVSFLDETYYCLPAELLFSLQKHLNYLKQKQLPETLKAYYQNTILEWGRKFTFDSYKVFEKEYEQLHWQKQSAEGSRQYSEVEAVNKKMLQEMPDIYLSKLPTTYLLARCPLCGGKVEEAVDTFSLNGVGWWINEPRGFGWFGRKVKGVRFVGDRFPEPSYQAECDHARAVVYGVNFNGIYPDDVTPTQFVVTSSERPGLLKPFMQQKGSTAVIHTLPIGRFDDEVWQPRYTAWFVTYFNPDPQAYLKSLAPQDPYHPLEFFWPYEQIDNNLLKWVKKKKLAWLGNEVEGYPLQQSPADFPYADMDGLEGRWAIYSGNRGGELHLLPRLNGHPLQNRRHGAFGETELIEQEVLPKRGLKRIKQP